MSESLPARRFPAPRFSYRLAVVVGAVAVSVVIALLVGAAGVSLDVRSPTIGALTIDPLLVVVSALPLALAGWGALVLIERRARRPRRVWTMLAVAVLALSLPPLLFLDATPAGASSLALMHLATGLTLILLLPRAGGRGPSPSR